MPFWSSAPKKGASSSSGSKRSAPRKAPPPQPFPPQVAKSARSKSGARSTHRTSDAQRQRSSRTSDRSRAGRTQSSSATDSRSQGRPAVSQPAAVPPPASVSTTAVSGSDASGMVDMMGGMGDDLFGGLVMMGGTEDVSVAATSANSTDSQADAVYDAALALEDDAEIKKAVAMSLAEESEASATAISTQSSGFGFVSSSVATTGGASTQLGGMVDMSGMMSMESMSALSTTETAESGSVSGGVGGSGFGFIGGGTAMADESTVPTSGDSGMMLGGGMMMATADDGSVHSAGPSTGFGFIQEGSVHSSEHGAMSTPDPMAVSSHLMAAAETSEAKQDASYQDVFGGLNVPEEVADLHASTVLTSAVSDDVESHVSDAESVNSSLFNVPAIPSKSMSATMTGSSSFGTPTPVAGSGGSSATPSRQRYDNSLNGQMKRMKNDWFKKEGELWTQIRKVADSERLMSNDIEVLQKKIEEMRALVVDFSSRKTEALKSDNFGEAQRCRKKIDELEITITDIDSRRIPKLKRDLQNLRKDKKRLEKELLRKCQRFNEKCVKLHEKLELDLNEYEKNEDHRLKNEEISVENGLENLEIEYENVMDDLNKCSDELILINDKIKEENEPLNDKLTELNELKVEINHEIEELEIKLREKRKKLTECDEMIEECNQDITQISEKYSKEISEIKANELQFDEKKEELIVQKSKMKCEFNKLKKERKSFNIEKFDKLLNINLIKFLIDFKNNLIVSRLEKSSDKYHSWDDIELGLNSDLRRLQNELQIITEERTKKESQLSTLENSVISEISKSLSLIDELLPQLQTAKVNAVTQENYSEAGAIHERIKLKTNEKDKLNETYQVKNRERNALKDELKSILSNEVEKKKLIEEFQFKLDFERFKFLLNDERDLNRSLNLINQAIDDFKQERTQQRSELSRLIVSLRQEENEDDSDPISGQSTIDDDLNSEERINEDERSEEDQSELDGIFGDEIQAIKSELSECESELDKLRSIYGWTDDTDSITAPGASSSSSSALDAAKEESSAIHMTDDSLFGGMSMAAADGSSSTNLISTLSSPSSSVVIETVESISAKLSEVDTKLEMTQSSLDELKQQITDAIVREDYSVPAKLKPAKDKLIAKVQELEDEKLKLLAKLKTIEDSTADATESKSEEEVSVDASELIGNGVTESNSNSEQPSTQDTSLLISEDGPIPADALAGKSPPPMTDDSFTTSMDDSLMSPKSESNDASIEDNKAESEDKLTQFAEVLETNEETAAADDLFGGLESPH